MRTDAARTPAPAPVPPGWTAYPSPDGRLALAHPAGWRVLSEGDASVHFELGVGYVVAARLERGSVARKATENDDEGNLREMVRAASLPWQPLNRLDIVEQGLWSGSPYRGYYYYVLALVHYREHVHRLAAVRLQLHAAPDTITLLLVHYRTRLSIGDDWALVQRIAATVRASV